MGSMTQTGGVVASTTLDFAAMLEAVALDPRVVPGKAANPSTKRACTVAQSTRKIGGNSAPKAMSVVTAGALRVPAVKARPATAKGAGNAATGKPAVASVVKSAIQPQPQVCTGARSVATPEGLEQKASKQKVSAPNVRKPPKSLRLRTTAAERAEQNLAPRPFEAEPLSAALHEDLLASDTVVLGIPSAQVPLVADMPVEEKMSAAPDAEAVVRRWPGPRRKCVTISVRLSPEDATMLRRRANESELSISDYLRSCVLEADQLRAQVKQVLAEMRMRAPEPMPQQEAREPVVRRSTTKSPQHQPASQPKAQPHQPVSRLQRWLAAWRGPLVAG